MRITTHYLPFFVRRLADGREQAACGQFVTAGELAPSDLEPTCDACAMWLREVDAPARVIGTITPSEPWGTSVNRQTAGRVASPAGAHHANHQSH